MFRSALRCSRPSRSKVRTLISNPQSQYDRWTPPELQDRSVWSPAARKSRISWDQRLVEEVTGGQHLRVFTGYLEAQAAVAAHILQFRSTHQYYRTAKYEPNRTTGDEDSSGYVFMKCRSGWIPANHGLGVSRSDQSGRMFDWPENKFQLSPSPTVRFSPYFAVR